ncbi:MAG: undecaprenyl/decaprenyl-phosphate alpha-N-acetylglucosaminyl 1-phosphate transferase [Anaerolineae bacterium]|nr:undecaprenyl/decaprenyl-phosphate alpha-N-acetylglucosaminyl 1-phosphate transferase [Anaerolineae bacterium]
MIELAAFITIFTLALGVTLLLMPVCDRLGQRWGMVAKAGGRRTTEADYRRVSKLGGFGMALGFVIAASAAQILPVPRLDPYEIVRFTGLILGTLLLMFAGLIDDHYELKALPQFIIQSLAAGIAISFQIFIEFFNNPLTGQQTDPFPFIVTVALSYFWLMLMMNTVNFIDGLDGLAGGVAIIAGAVLLINGVFRLGQISVSLLHVALIGSALGFTLYNFYPARIFMGSGAVTLGFILGALSIIGGAKMATILFVVGLPLLDTVWQALTRLLQGRSPFEGDRGHLHFRLLDMGFSQRQIVIGYYLFCALFGVLTLVVESRLFKLIALGAMCVLIALGFALVTRWRARRNHSAEA